MPPPQYEAIVGGADDADSPTSVNYPLQPSARPATYYGEGDFDPPSSDDEEEVFLEKKPPHALGVSDEERDAHLLEDEGELVIGGRVRESSSLRVIVSHGGCRNTAQGIRVRRCAG